MFFQKVFPKKFEKNMYGVFNILSSTDSNFNCWMDRSFKIFCLTKPARTYKVYQVFIFLVLFLEALKLSNLLQVTRSISHIIGLR